MYNFINRNNKKYDQRHVEEVGYSDAPTPKKCNIWSCLFIRFLSYRLFQKNNIFFHNMLSPLRGPRTPKADPSMYVHMCVFVDVCMNVYYAHMYV